MRQGPRNAITDVAGVKVGVATRVADGPHVVRTGVTAIWPRGEEIWQEYCFAGTSSFNGNGEMTGTHWIKDGGYFLGPVLVTNTHGIGACHTGATRWMIDRYPDHFRNGSDRGFHFDRFGQRKRGSGARPRTPSFNSNDVFLSLSRSSQGHPR